MTKKETKTEAEIVPKSVEELILNYQSGKYSAIPLAALWAKVLRKKEENRHLTPAEILDLALKDVLGGEIGWKDVKKAFANGVAIDAAAAAEEKAKAK